MEKEIDQNKKVIIVGDACVDNIMVPISSKDFKHNNNLEIFKLPCGALLIRDIFKAFPGTSNDLDILSYPDINDANSLSQDIIQSISEGEAVKDKEKGAGETYYIKKFIGYQSTNPGSSVPGFASNFILESQCNRSIEEGDMIIIDDAGYGFRNVESAWKNILDRAEQNEHTVLIYNMSAPLFSGKLWETLSQKNLVNRLILIIDADSLRDEGVNISRKLSWDRTIADFVTVLGYKKFSLLEKCPHLLIRFGLEGVLYYHSCLDQAKELKRKTQVFYIPNSCEEEIVGNSPGKMNGLSSAFTGFLGRKIMENKNAGPDITRAISDAVPLAAEQVIQLFKMGYIKESGRLQFAYEKVLAGKTAGLFKSLDLNLQEPGYLESSRKSWDILSHQIPLDYHLKDIAVEYVINGKSKELENIPLGQFGKLLTIDKNEIENFRSIKNLVKEYLVDNTINKPLPVAVFGPPGSGKSFAVKSVVNGVMEAILRKKADVLEYNISQFDSPQDIIRAFHEVRDYALKGAIPLVFFDEFDSSLKNERLGWLKYFLAPMQDGEFKEGEKTHPIGKCILVFAGGTSRSLKEFSRHNHFQKENNEDDYQRFIAAKGPDFVSRLKGYVNILGPNPINHDDQEEIAPFRDRFFIIRRAVLLRALLLQQPNLVDKENTIHIDEDVLRALLLIPRYKHGARSMSAIINMSMLGGRSRFEKAALPSSEQLELHVDAEVFMNIIDRDLTINVAALDRAIHDTYCNLQEEKIVSNGKAGSVVQTWDDLAQDMKQLNRVLAESIPFYLLLINCNYRQKEEDSNKEIEFTEKEIDYMAQMAHERWAHEKCCNGWSYGEKTDNDKKLHVCLTSWERLPEELKGVDRNTIKSLPRILGSAGFEIYRLQ
ncbi:MAG: RyR domain-containing protein [Acidobacteria bacterium]|nr:RyR domain-containing protein [Acidobacteriota bacterium]